LKGLAVNEVSSLEVLGNKDERVDSDFWTMEPVQNPNLCYEKIGKHLLVSQYGASISMNDEGVGAPIYRMNEIHNMMCDLNIAKFADLDEKELKQLTLAPRDVLFNRTNSYEWVGRTGLFLGHEGPEAVFASYLVRFRTKHKTLLPEYLVAFLNCKYGVVDIKRRSRQSINQTNVNPEEVKEIAIPLLSMAIQEEIKLRFEQAFEGQKGASQALQKAEATLLASLGLAGWSPPEPLSYTARAADALTAARLDAQYFRPKYQEAFALLKGRGNAKELGSLVSLNSRGRQPIYADAGLPVINSKHVRTNHVNLSDDNRFGEIDKSPVVIKNGDVLLNGTGVGTIGRAAPYLFEHDALPDNHVTVIRPDKIDPIYLSVFLNSTLGQLQIEQLIKGSSGQIELYPDDIAKIIIWDAPNEVQRAVREALLSAKALEARSGALLSSAKRAVEIAIEDGEAAALAFLAR
jgi:restriction endonuclease S subunit